MGVPHRSNRGVLLTLVIFCAAAWGLIQCPQAGAADALAESYQAARARCNALLAGSLESLDRRGVEKCIGEISKIMEADTDGRLADKCLYLIGLSRQRLYHAFHNYHDYRLAVQSFEAIVQGYSGSALAAGAKNRLDAMLAGEEPPGGAKTPRIVNAVASGDQPPETVKVVDRRPFTPPEHPPAALAPPVAKLQKIETSLAPNGARVALLFDGPVAFKERFDPGDAKGRKLAALHLEIRNAVIGPGVRSESFPKDRTIREVKVAQVAPRTVRVTLRAASVEACKASSLADPFRIIVDFKEKAPAPPSTPASPASPSPPPPGGPAPVEPAPASPPITTSSMDHQLVESHMGSRSFRASMPKPGHSATGDASAAASAEERREKRLGLGLQCIVLDPGHGGRDKGAISLNGVYEKNITLAVAKELKKRLSLNNGCKVMLTRSSDRYLSLEERTAFANKSGADLFVSIHTNAHRDRDLHGVETYFLSPPQDGESTRVAEMENASSGKRISDLDAILQDLMLNTKINESGWLAQKVQDSLIGRLRKDYSGVRDLGVKKAPFYVLVGARMPCVLVELAFLTNKEEEKRLMNKSYRKMLASGINDGIDAYVRHMGQFARAGETQ